MKHDMFYHLSFTTKIQSLKKIHRRKHEKFTPKFGATRRKREKKSSRHEHDLRVRVLYNA